jgi:dihydrofolate reductase
MGRVTYEEMAEFWPTSDDAYAAPMNDIPKVVFSHRGDGTAVPDRSADASDLRALVEELCALGLDLVVVTGTHVGNVDGQLGARPAGLFGRGRA